MNLLEGDLVTNGQHDYAVLGASRIMVENLGQAKIVAGVNHEIRELVRQTERNREVNLLVALSTCNFNFMATGCVL